jgi:hypothetical protein
MTREKLIQLIQKDINKYPQNLKKTDTRSFNYQIDDLSIYINPNRLTTGNSKLIDILIFDTPAGSVEGSGTCRNCDACSDTCYARHQQLQYPNTRIFRLINQYLMEYDPKTLLKLIKTQMSNIRKNIKTFRIHSSGDFINQSEIDFWNKIIKEYSDIKFYAYTKVEYLDDFTEIESNFNFNLIRSFIEFQGELYLNYGSLDYVAKLAKKINGYVCPATIPDSNIKCNKGCKYCINNDKVLFVIHGTNKKVDRNLKKLKPSDLIKIIKINKKIDNDFIINVAS